MFALPGSVTACGLPCPHGRSDGHEGEPVRRARGRRGGAAPARRLRSGRPADRPAPSGPRAATGSSSAAARPSGTGDPAHAVPTPGPLEGRLWQPDLLVLGAEPLTDDVVGADRRAARRHRTERLSVAQVGIENGVITVAAVDPATYRRYTPLAVSAQLGRRLDPGRAGPAGDHAGDRQAAAPTGDGTCGWATTSTRRRCTIGALAPQIPRVDAVVNDAWGAELGMPRATRCSCRRASPSPQSVRPRSRRSSAAPRLGADPRPRPGHHRRADRRSSPAARWRQRVGSFSYRILDGGRIAPDPAWVAANIRTERVPILGAVTCHRVMLPQLRAALTEVVDQGLADAIHPEQFAGCYYPRYIAGTARAEPARLRHRRRPQRPRRTSAAPSASSTAAWSPSSSAGASPGAATWGYTDPMHFELNALVGGG